MFLTNILSKNSQHREFQTKDTKFHNKKHVEDLKGVLRDYVRFNLYLHYFPFPSLTDIPIISIALE